MTTARSLGFAIPTVLLVTVLHLVERASFGEAMDGLVSGLWFAGLFWLGTSVRELRALGQAMALSPALEMALGSLAACLGWAFLWGFWAFAPADASGPPGVSAFWINSATMLVLALVLPRRGAVAAAD